MLQVGDIIDSKYRILRVLGQGGMGAVYEGENVRIHRRVAIKVLHAAVAARVDVVQRFEREAQAAGRIGSEHIVEVLDLGNLPSGERYMVMEFLEGESLGDRIKARERLTPAEVAPIVHQVLEGLAAAHEAGIIHRDLKPDNVFIVRGKGSKRDFVKVLDFGVSKFSALDADSLAITRAGAVMGTPYYMSPEQARGSKIDHRSDLYSTGVVLYQATTGRLPFQAETFNELVFKIALEAPVPCENLTPALDASFASIIARAMARDVTQRFQTAAEFQSTLAQWMAGAMSGVGSLPSGVLPGQVGAMPGVNTATPNGSSIGPRGTMVQSFPGATPSGGGLSQSGGSLSHSGSLHQSAGGFGTSNSHAALAVTNRQSRGAGAMIAIGLISTLLVAGGAVGVYLYVHATPAPAATMPDPPPAPPDPVPPPSAETAAPPVSSDPPPVASEAPIASARPSSHPGLRPPIGGKRPGPPASAAPTAAPKSTGRVIGSEL